MDCICTLLDGECQAPFRLSATHTIYSTPASWLIIDDWPNTHHHANKMDLPLRHCTLRNRIPVLCRGAEHELSVIVLPLLYLISTILPYLVLIFGRAV